MRGVRSGADPQTMRAPNGCPSTVPEQVTFMKIAEEDASGVLDGERRRSLNTESWLLLAAARLALRDAEQPQEAMERTGIVVSTGHAGLQDYAELFLGALGKDAVARRAHPGARPEVSPLRGPQTGLNAPAANLSIRLNARGPNMTLTNGAAGGIDALDYADNALKAGRATTMLVGGVEVVPPVIHALRHERGRRGQAIPRPFDRHRAGPLLGEAAVVVVLERETSAKRRGVRTQARVRSTASAFAPDGSLERACERSLTAALERCSLSPRQVGAVFAGASGSIDGDAAESRALYAVFGDRTPVCAVKGATADSIGAAALVQLAVALCSWRERVIPATPGFRSRGADIAPIDVLAAPRPLSSASSIVVHAWDAQSSAASAVLDGPPVPTSATGSR
jgi:3-oxoacyl-[acyl-carrier-protein] synthase II